MRQSLRQRSTILTHELLYRLNLAPDFDPKIEGKLTPDIAVEISGLRFIVDVLVTHSPSKTITRFGPRMYQGIDQGERAQKILNTITEKSAKYAKTGLPLVLFVFLGDYSIHTDDVERALFSLTLGEIEPNERFQESFAACKFGGVLLPDACGVPSHPNLSAVVACQWFDTLHRGNPGRRLHCVVLHHYSPHVLLPGTFSPFPEVLWHSEALRIGSLNALGNGTWLKELPPTGNSNLGGTLQMHPGESKIFPGNKKKREGPNTTEFAEHMP